MTKHEIKQKLLELAASDNSSLDIRVRGALPRPMDQKVTPDVLCAVAKTILSLGKPTFTNGDLIESEVFNEQIIYDFGKPTSDSSFLKNEYDKFVSQPVNTLTYANILKRVSHTKFTWKSQELLQFISESWKNSEIFLAVFIELYLTESEIFDHFDSYLKKASPSKNDFVKLRIAFIDFIFKNTNIKNKNEVTRILPKVLNILAYDRNSFGTKHGSSSKEKIVFLDLMYSTLKNPRDLEKRRNESRAEWKIRVGKIDGKSIASQVAVMKKYVKENYGYKSALSHAEGIEVHHILTEAQFPQYKATPENMITLTSQEHRHKAHPNGNTTLIDENIQLQLLKIQRQHILSNPDKYDIQIFNEMLQTANIELS